MKGKLFGVSVGPGDPELMTLRSVRILNECEIIAVPRTKGENTLALDIISQCCDLSGKELIYLDFPMTSDKNILDEYHEKNTEIISSYLDKGQNTALITIGDISVYSTFSYISSRIMQKGYDVEVCAGVTSFCAAAAELKKPLVLGKQPLIITSPSSPDFTALLNSCGTKVIMKSGKSIAGITEKLEGKKAYAVEKCTLPDQRIIADIKDMVDSSYFTTIIVYE